MRTALLAALVLVVLAPAAVAQQDRRFDYPPLYPPGPRPQVMILGTGHFANPRRDVNNAAVDDMLAPRRQAELEELAERLARYAPTRIAVEVPVERQGWLDSAYAAYLAGTAEPDRGEITQVAFRLAKRLGHARVYAVDYKQGMRIPEVMAWGAAHGAGAQVARMQRYMGGFIPALNAAVARLTVVEMLREANRPDNLAISHQPYLAEARIAADTSYPGWEDVAGWYARNLRIFVNVSRLAAGPDDRVLVLFGAGHAPLLRQYVAAAGDLELVEPDRYLGGE